MKTFNSIFVMSTIVATSLAFTFQQDKPWKVPDSANEMKNPVENNGEAIGMGKMFYSKHCKSCHGKNGEGDGTKSAELKTFPGDFTLEKFQGQTDGAIFYKTMKGRDDMPSFEKKIEREEDVWAIIHYIRTFK